MRIYLQNTMVITADEITGNITTVYQKGSVKPEAIYDVTNTMVGLRLFYQEVNRFLNISIYNTADPDNRISDAAGVPYANAQMAFNAICDIVGFNSDGSGGAVSSVNGQTGSVTVDFDSVLTQGNDSPIRALFNGVPYLTENDTPVFLTETSVFADIQPNRLHIYIGNAPLLFDLDVIIAQPPAPNPPQQNFSVANNSGFNFGIISGSGSSGVILAPRYSYVNNVTITDIGVGYWEVSFPTQVQSPSAQQVFSQGNEIQNISAIFRDNIGNQTLTIYEDGIFARDTNADREVWYNSRFLRVSKNFGFKTWFLNFPDLTSNVSPSSFAVNFRPNISGTVAYLSDIANLNLPVFIDETFTISGFQTGVTYYYVGASNVTYDYDTQPYPLPIPVSNFNYVNLSVYDVTFLSNTGNNGFVLTPNQRLLGIFFNDNGAAWEINAVEYFDNIYNLQQVSNKGNETFQALIVRNNPNNYRTVYSVIGQQIQYDVGGVRVEYTYDKIQVNQNSTLANFTINLPNIATNPPASNTVVNFRPTVSGTVAYLSDNIATVVNTFAGTYNVITANVLLVGTAENQIVNLGNATTYANGYKITLFSENTEVISVVNNGNIEIARLEVCCKIEFVLINNSTANGVWNINTLYPSYDKCGVFSDDFISPTTAGQTNWTSTTSGGGSSIIVTTAVNRVGLIQLSTGTTPTGRATYNKGNSSFVFGGGVTVIEYSILIPTLSTLAEEYIMSVGTGDNTAAGDHTDGLYFEYSRLASGDVWRIKNSNGGVRTTVVTTQAITANTWYKLKIEVNGTATAATYFVNDVNIGTAVGNIPVLTGRNSDLILKIEKTAGTLARTLVVDYSHVRIYKNR